MRLLCVAIFILSGFSSFAQNTRQKLDSLEAALRSSRPDTNKVLLLCNMSSDYYEINPEQGVEYGKQALALAKKLEYDYGLVKSNNVIARCYAIQSQYSSALKHYKDALLVAKKMNNPVYSGVLLTALGAVYTEKREYEKALDYLMQARDVYENAGMKIASSLANNIGFLHNAKGDHPEALKWYLEGIAIEEQSKPPSEELEKLYNNAGAQYIKTENYGDGMKYLFKALAMEERNGNDNMAAITCADIGAAYLRMAREQKKALPDSLQSKERNIEEAIYYLHRAAELCSKMNMQGLQQTVYADLSKAYEARGDYYRSKIYLEKHVAVRDSLRDFAKEKAFAKVEAMYLFRKKTDSLKYLNTLKDKELRQKRLERNGGIIGITLIGIISLLLVNRQKLKHKQKRKLAETEVRHTKETAQKQLDTFAKSIHEKNLLIEKFTAELEKYQALPCSNELVNKDRAQNELQNSVILTEEQWANFQVLFEQVHEGYINRVNETFEGLTAAELRFVLLTRLGMNNREMAAMLGVGVEAIRVVKHRLLKKIQLPEGENFEEAVFSI